VSHPWAWPRQPWPCVPQKSAASRRQSADLRGQAGVFRGRLLIMPLARSGRRAGPVATRPDGRSGLARLVLDLPDDTAEQRPCRVGSNYSRRWDRPVRRPARCTRCHHLRMSVQGGPVADYFVDRAATLALPDRVAAAGPRALAAAVPRFRAASARVPACAVSGSLPRKTLIMKLACSGRGSSQLWSRAWSLRSRRLSAN
jgi:hypothetical protein